mmetsp:Transcript_23353/g.39613  ORF Transcript_23353/g.39613 Transcript_23353/m.39613 type:complete len:249 (+) Transcript_23353:1696-2442(+)
MVKLVRHPMQIATCLLSTQSLLEASAITGRRSTSSSSPCCCCPLADALTLPLLPLKRAVQLPLRVAFPPSRRSSLPREAAPCGPVPPLLALIELRLRCFLDNAISAASRSLASARRRRSSRPHHSSTSTLDTRTFSSGTSSSTVFCGYSKPKTPTLLCRMSGSVMSEGLSLLTCPRRDARGSIAVDNSWSSPNVTLSMMRKRATAFSGPLFLKSSGSWKRKLLSTLNQGLASVTTSVRRSCPSTVTVT